jgi:23S rRNA pseudouridine1911/1915/1917 synthase
VENQQDPADRNINLTVYSAGSRVDKFIADSISWLSRSQIQKLIRQSFITVNKKSTKTSQILRFNDCIQIRLPPSQILKAEPIQLNIIYEDRDIIVINKPAGMVVYPGPGHPEHTLVNAILAYCPSLLINDELIRPGIVHRLDKDTSGLIVIAKNVLVKEFLVNQFKNHTVVKKYFVLVEGHLSPERGIIEAPIGRDPHNFKRMTLIADGKEAITNYTVIKYYSGCTLIDATLKTGRTHQIRVHLSAIGHSVIGDSIYGRQSPHLKRQFLHAHQLGLYLPSNGIFHSFNCLLPYELENVLTHLSYSI